MALGLRPRRVHDLRRTFVSLCIEDGADRDKLRLATHGAPGQDVIGLYTTLGWSTLCKQIQVLKIRRLARSRSSAGV
jgi:hypothetical protein